MARQKRRRARPSPALCIQRLTLTAKVHTDLMPLVAPERLSAPRWQLRRKQMLTMTRKVRCRSSSSRVELWPLSVASYRRRTCGTGRRHHRLVGAGAPSPQMRDGVPPALSDITPPLPLASSLASTHSPIRRADSLLQTRGHSRRAPPSQGGFTVYI